MGAGVVAWFVLLAALWAVRRPRRARAGPESTDLGVESPAVANLVTSRFNPTREAVPATLVDLAARGFVEIEDRGIGQYWCRLTGRTGPLTPHEQMMIDHLRSVAAGGVVPAEALTTGPQDRSKAWWSDFRKKVVAEAKGAGLCADLWDLRSQAILFGAGVVLLLLYAVATGFNEPDEVQRSALYDAVTLGGVLAAVALGAVIGSNRQTSTDPGVAAASRWLGVKRALDDSPSFDVLPPSGVAVWERHLAYACALGVAPRSIQALPMGAESDTDVWTASGGEWRKVTVAYPRFRPGWGRHPLLALALGALGSLFGWWLLRLATGDLGGDSVALKVFALVVLALAVLALTRSLPQLLFGFLDLFASRSVEGPVLRARTRWAPIPYTFQGTDREYLRFFVAVDDGRSAKLTAYRVKPELFDGLPQGSQANLKVTPNLGHVRLP